MKVEIVHILRDEYWHEQKLKHSYTVRFKVNGISSLSLPCTKEEIIEKLELTEEEFNKHLA